MKEKALKEAVKMFKRFFHSDSSLSDVKKTFCGLGYGDMSIRLHGKGKVEVEMSGEKFIFKIDYIYGLAFGFEQKEMEL